MTTPLLPKPEKPVKARRQIVRVRPRRCADCPHRSDSHPLTRDGDPCQKCRCAKFVPLFKPIPRASKPIARKKRPARMRKTPMGRLERILDGLFSKYVRERDFGLPCITCPTALHGKYDAGHFNRRAVRATRWDPKNVHGQCAPDNQFRRGAPAEYALAIIDRYGIEELRRLMRLRKYIKKWTRAELEELISALQKSGADFEMLYYERHGGMGL